MSLDRLSSFLRKKSMLKTTYMYRIQKHVFYMEAENGDQLILKRHNNRLRVEHQWHFFDRQTCSFIVPFRRFPNDKRFLIDNGYCWTISPYIPGRKLNYASPGDRAASLRTLQTFHTETKGIRINRPFRKELFYQRWYNRLQRFKNTEHLFKQLGFATLFLNIVQTTEHQLQELAHSPLSNLENESLKTGIWIHGDVASHNFIRYDGHVFMIDFDLLTCTSGIYDYIQLGQRFLPYLDWDLNRLMSYKMVHEKHLKLWLDAILLPSDIMREWLHYINGNSSRLAHDYLTELETNWNKRQSFLKMVQTVLN